MKMKATILKTILVLLLLTGCSIWQDEFDEPVRRGLPKAYIHQISTLVDRGIIKEEEAQEAGLPSLVPVAFSEIGEVHRIPEEIRRVYLTAYEDGEGTLHGVHHLHVVIRPARWRRGEGKQ
jgi:hypothetical protein